MNMPLKFNGPFRQSGVALFTVLVFLVVLTILALTAMRSSSLGERMARNTTDRNLAMQAAEAALADAENDIECLMANNSPCDKPTLKADSRGSQRPLFADGGGTFDGNELCTNGQCDFASRVLSSDDWDNKPIWDNAVTYGRFTGAAPIPIVSEQPRYLIQYQEKGNSINPKRVFHILALGFGADRNTQVLLQATYNPIL
jgi:type IV pilus assembly protein PilX